MAFNPVQSVVNRPAGPVGQRRRRLQPQEREAFLPWETGIVRNRRDHEQALWPATALGCTRPRSSTGRIRSRTVWMMLCPVVDSRSTRRLRRS